MKYAVFWAVLAAVPVLAALFAFNKRWMRWALYGMAAGLYLYEQTSISFMSNESYQGTAKGMEISLIHILSAAIVAALAIRGKTRGAFPEPGIRLYALFFLLCLPSLWNADSLEICWLEIWKLLMLFVFWHAVYGYLTDTGDAGTVVAALVLFALANTLKVVQQHYSFMLAKGVFPHRNSMAMAMNLLGPLFLAGYLQMGFRERLGRVCAAGFAGAALCGMWSYSRGAIATLPVGYGIAAGAALAGARRGRRKVFVRLLPILLAGLAGLAVIWVHLVQRFEGAPEGSKTTRIMLAHCALEMMKDHPWVGVGVNNWAMNMRREYHAYLDRAEEKLGWETGLTGIVETVYLLTGAECGIPALLAMLVWFAWHEASCLKMAWLLRGTRWHFVAAGLSGGLAANYLQSTLEWVLRQRRTMFLLFFCFALAAWLRSTCRERGKAA